MAKYRGKNGKKYGKKWKKEKSSPIAALIVVGALAVGALLLVSGKTNMPAGSLDGDNTLLWLLALTFIVILGLVGGR